MKHGKRPTREQKKLIQSKRMKPDDWMVERDTPEKLVLVHRNFDSVTRTIHKEIRDEY